MPRLDAGRVAAWRSFGVVATEVQRKVEAGLVDDYDLPLSWFEVLAASSCKPEFASCSKSTMSSPRCAVSA